MRARERSGLSLLRQQLFREIRLPGCNALDRVQVNAVVPGNDRQREMAFRTGINVVMYALTGNYKADQVHVPALLERLGQ